MAVCIQGEKMKSKSYEIAAEIRPAERQIKWQDMEFYACVFYGMNTFTGKDIGDGFAVPAMFCPENINTDEWAETVAKGGMKGIMVTAKHYDGFCNWQTETTDYSVKSSNWLGGKGDVVKLVADSARKFGLKFGLYLPVWDRHEKSFKSSDGSFNSFFIAQLKELLTSYGEIFELWLDDRCDDGISFDFDYKTVYETVRELQPDCAIVYRGPDGRWVGNNRGVTRTSEWSVVPAAYTFDEDGTVPFSNKKKKMNQMEIDLGSRSAIRHETEFRWSPCEVNYLMRPHLFYKKDDDMLSKTKDKLLDIYYRTVGNNSNLVLCLAPDKRGRLNDSEVQILNSTGHDLKVILGYNLLKDGKINASSELSKLYKAENILKDDSSFWTPANDDKKPELIINFDKAELFDKIILKEHIRNGQNVEEFIVYVDVKGKWKKHAKVTTIGHKRICPIKLVESTGVKIVFEKFRKPPQIEFAQIN